MPRKHRRQTTMEKEDDINWSMDYEFLKDS